MKLFIALLSLVFLSLYLNELPQAHAGGCCFSSFNATTGIPLEKAVIIDVGFVDPRVMGPDVGSRTLANEVIQIHTDISGPNQGCVTETQTTNEFGSIRATCVSNVPGSFFVWFSAPDLENKYNEFIGSVKKPIYFEGDQISPQISLPATPQISPEDQDIQRLDEKITELEKEVTSQGKQVNWLTKVVESILNFFQSILKFKS